MRRIALRQGCGRDRLAPERVTFDSLDRDPATGAPVRITGLLFRPPNPDGVRRPAIVALHGCGGMYSALASRRDELSVRHRAMAELLTDEGYIVLFPDSFRPRGRDEICTVENRGAHDHPGQPPPRCAGRARVSAGAPGRGAGARRRRSAGRTAAARCWRRSTRGRAPSPRGRSARRAAVLSRGRRVLPGLRRVAARQGRIRRCRPADALRRRRGRLDRAAARASTSPESSPPPASR